MTSALISAQELHALVGKNNVKILDATYGQPPFARGIPGAVDFDIDDIADPDAPLAHTIPSADTFARKVGALGVGNGDLVVVYDRAGIHMAASRAWWMFRLFGHDNVKILNGGLKAWMAAGLPLENKKSPAAPASFRATLRPGLITFAANVKENIDTGAFTVLDARDALRFAGKAAEPRPGMAAGHIPGSLNMPFADLVDPATGGLKPKSELERIFAARDIPMNRPLACSCGSGVTACVVALGLYETGKTDAAVYDGSWAEWGGRDDTPIER